jgi:hypothetical protein
VTADVPFMVIGVPFRRGEAASSDLQVSIFFIHTNDMPVFCRFSCPFLGTFPFPLGRKML